MLSSFDWPLGAQRLWRPPTSPQKYSCHAANNRVLRLSKDRINPHGDEQLRLLPHPWCIGPLPLGEGGRRFHPELDSGSASVPIWRNLDLRGSSVNNLAPMSMFALQGPMLNQVQDDRGPLRMAIYALNYRFRSA
jgi:hypothetical protein